MRKSFSLAFFFFLLYFLGTKHSHKECNFLQLLLVKRFHALSVTSGCVCLSEKALFFLKTQVYAVFSKKGQIGF